MLRTTHPCRNFCSPQAAAPALQHASALQCHFTQGLLQLDIKYKLDYLFLLRSSRSIHSAAIVTVSGTYGTPAASPPICQLLPPPTPVLLKLSS